MIKPQMKPSQSVTKAVENLLAETDFYDPGSVEVALDALASTLAKQFKVRSLFGKPKLSKVLAKLHDKRLLTNDDVKTFERIEEILDANAYPEGVEIEEADELEELIQ